MASLFSRESIEKVKLKLSEWDDPVSPKAPLTQLQLDELEKLQKIKCEQEAIILGNEGIGAEESVNSVHGFLTLCSNIEGDIEEDVNRPYATLVSQLGNWKSDTEVLLEAVNAASAALTKLREQHESVSGSTGALHSACRALAGQEAKLTDLSEQMSARLEPLTSLEPMAQRLCNPALNLSGGTFYLALSRLDQSLQYVEAHPEYKEYATFRAQAHFALSRAVTTMKDSVMENFKHATQQVLALPAQTDLSDGASLALTVGRFQASAAKARQVIKHVEARLHVAPEYSRLISECSEAYMQQRKMLLASSVSAAVTELTVKHRGDHCTLLRAACAFCLHVCLDEFHLYFHFFSASSSHLVEYLDGLCTNLYDILRPIIIHVNHLETLAELCTILRFELLEEQIPSNPEALDSLRRILLQLLQDVQERLVFRAHIYLDVDILQYNPSAGDIAYPEKLIMMESIAQEVQANSQQSIGRKISVASSVSAVIADADGSESQVGASTRSSPADLHGMWYPPVRRVLATLSRLYRCVDRGIFQGLSQEALASCVKSVSRAAALIAARSTQVDASLFEMKHLLILREQVAPFHVDFTVLETSLDFTRVKSAVYNLIQKRNQLFSLSNNALLEFLLEGTPTVRQLTVDSRKEVDRQLKSVCEAFIDHATQLLTPGVCTTILKIQGHNAGAAPLKEQPWFSPEALSAAVADSQRAIKAQLPQLHKSLQLYLACRDTEQLLYRHIKGRILGGFQLLEQTIRDAGFNDEQRTLIALPTTEQVQLLLNTASQAADS